MGFWPTSSYEIYNVTPILVHLERVELSTYNTMAMKVSDDYHTKIFISIIEQKSLLAAPCKFGLKSESLDMWGL